jgi:hypothetical protein
MRCHPGPSRGLRAPVVALLLGALLGLVVVQDTQFPHVHEARTAGIYDEQHVLDTLARLSGAVPLPGAPAPGVVAAVAPAPALPDVPPTAARPERHADPRAPPSC